MTRLETANVTNPFHGVIGVINQATPAIPPVTLTSSRSALRILFRREGWAEPARKLYPQSHSSALSGLANSQMGHSFIEEVVWAKQFRR
jgi:hypothetical protein